jgi:hypothetical protein
MRRRDARETQEVFEVAGLVKECIWTRVYKSGNSTLLMREELESLLVDDDAVRDHGQLYDVVVVVVAAAATLLKKKPMLCFRFWC